MISVLILSGCQLFGSSKSDNLPSEQSSKDNSKKNNQKTNDQKNNEATNTTTPTTTTNTTQQDPVEAHGIAGLIQEFNNKVGDAYGITMQNPKLYQEDANNATFSITLSDGNGVGIVVVKATKNVKDISIVSPATTNDQYEEFFKAAGVFLLYIDDSATEDVVQSILEKLGYGKPVEQINNSFESTDLQLKTEYDAATKQIYFDIHYKNH